MFLISDQLFWVSRPSANIRVVSLIRIARWFVGMRCAYFWGFLRLLFGDWRIGVPRSLTIVQMGCKNLQYNFANVNDLTWF
jgi:hypothetical protein